MHTFGPTYPYPSICANRNEAKYPRVFFGPSFIHLEAEMLIGSIHVASRGEHHLTLALKG
jgi:hypothetical protein